MKTFRDVLQCEMRDFPTLSLISTCEKSGYPFIYRNPEKRYGGSLPVKTIYHWDYLLWGGNTIVYVTQSTFKVKVHRKF